MIVGFTQVLYIPSSLEHSKKSAVDINWKQIGSKVLLVGQPPANIDTGSAIGEKSQAFPIN